MADNPITIHSWPRAILHIDGDAFFASCEQAIHPELKDKPVITGKERGIVAAASYKAKALGVKRGMRLFEVKKICPDAVILPSDYETYSLFSLNMFAIIRRFTPIVEEYSIDEAFADLTGLRRPLRASYSQIAANIQKTVTNELGLSVSVGLSLSKGLAKLSSNYHKPDGLTILPGRLIHLVLKKTPVEKVWGIGPNTSAYLKKLGIFTALDYAKTDSGFIEKRFSKPYVEIWRELNGESVYPVVAEGKTSYKSISKTKTFTPPSSDQDFIYGQIARNLENACIKARRHNLSAGRLIIFLRRQNFQTEGVEVKLNRATAYPADIFPFLKELFNRLYKNKWQYRATGIVLAELTSDPNRQLSLFESPVKIIYLKRLYEAIDKINARFGKHTLHHLSAMPAKARAQHENARGNVPSRKQTLLKGENERQHLGLPIMKIDV